MQAFCCLRDLRFEINIRSRKVLNKDKLLSLITINKIVLIYIKQSIQDN